MENGYLDMKCKGMHMKARFTKKLIMEDQCPPHRKQLYFRAPIELISDIFQVYVYMSSVKLIFLFYPYTFLDLYFDG